jgi:glycosyltransferase involved in cell wall biosynthesis
VSSPFEYSNGDDTWVKRTDVIIPALNEAQTIFEVVRAAREGLDNLELHDSSVFVVSDGSIDGTDDIAASAGAVVLRRDGGSSKASSMALGVSASEASRICFLDADCVGLRPDHISQLLRLHSLGSVAMAVGTFDYALFSGAVQRVPWSTGQRVVDRDVFEAAAEFAQGYGIEVAINREIGRRRGRTVSMVLEGCKQRTKSQKHGRIRGTRDNVRMWRTIALEQMREDNGDYLAYARSVEILDTNGEIRPQGKMWSALGYIGLLAAGRVLSGR